MDIFSQPGLLPDSIYAISMIGGGLILFYIIFFVLKKWSKRKGGFIPGLLEKYLHLAGVLFFIVIALNISLERIRDDLSLNTYQNTKHTLGILLILSFSLLLVRTITMLRELALSYYTRKDSKDYILRSAKTKFQIIERVLNLVIIISTLAAVLMTFNNIKQIGTTLLASAGVAGIVLGFAAQKSLGSLFAGIQIAISQPIKIEDIVVVEGQFGTIGEITLTYVVINTWDEKRLIVPINYFLENSFENWTRISPEVVAQVKVYTDYTLPIDEVRKEFNTWLQNTNLWDKRTAALLVTDADSKTIEIRATMSARNSSDAFDLECMIREKLIRYIREKYPDALPASRVKSTKTDELALNRE